MYVHQKLSPLWIKSKTKHNHAAETLGYIRQTSQGIFQMQEKELSVYSREDSLLTF